MKPVYTAVLPPDTVPPQGTELVLFSDTKPYLSETLASEMLRRAARYAKKYGVYLIPQRFLVRDYLCLCLVAPNGRPVAAQRATHLNVDYRERHMQRVSEISPFDTPLGRMALLADVDFCMPQTARQVACEGAEIIIASQFVQPYDYFEDNLIATAQSAACSNGVPVVAAMSGYGIICRPDGETVCSPFEDVPIAAAVTPCAMPGSLRAGVAEARAVLVSHGELFTTGGDTDAE